MPDDIPDDSELIDDGTDHLLGYTLFHQLYSAAAEDYNDEIDTHGEDQANSPWYAEDLPPAPSQPLYQTPNTDLPWYAQGSVEGDGDAATSPDDGIKPYYIDNNPYPYYQQGDNWWGKLSPSVWGKNIVAGFKNSWAGFNDKLAGPAGNLVQAADDATGGALVPASIAVGQPEVAGLVKGLEFAGAASKAVSAAEDFSAASKVARTVSRVAEGERPFGIPSSPEDFRPIAKQISEGHAFDKHVIDEGQFPGITTPKQFENHIVNSVAEAMKNPETDIKPLDRNKIAFLNEKDQTIVVRDPMHKDGGTAFKPYPIRPGGAPVSAREAFNKVR